jgi:2-polyprenyl-6-methoxyphenol hydroxylase-like FAD-dependent oxidoreductase
VNQGASYTFVVPNDITLGFFKDFHKRYHYLIKLAAPGSIRAWPLLGVDPPPSTWAKGKAVLIGDAAHPMWPCK